MIDTPQLMLPEYKIELLNKSKKIIDKIENINQVKSVNLVAQKTLLKNQKIDKKNYKVLSKKI